MCTFANAKVHIIIFKLDLLMKNFSTLLIVLIALVMMPQAVSAQSVVEFDFLNNSLNLPVGNADDINAGNLGGKSIIADGVTISLVNSSTMPTRYYFNANKNQLQLIAGGQIRFTAADGQAITKIEITPVAATNNKWEVDNGVGTLSEDKLTPNSRISTL